MIVDLNEQEHATVLAALHYYRAQGQGHPANRDDDTHRIATAGDAVSSLDGPGVAALETSVGTYDDGDPNEGAHICYACGWELK